jgi:hypothetical protein
MRRFLCSLPPLAWLVTACVALGCSSAEATPHASSDDGKDPGPLPWSRAAIPALPQDNLLRVNDIQAKATHNSYHIETPGNTLPDWHYTLAPLDVQLSEQGVRQIELDLHLVSLDDEFEVYHLPALDEQTTCRKLRDCLRTIATWSGDHPGHMPLTIQFEPKQGFTSDDPEAYFSKLEAEILSVFVEERIVTPDEVQGESATLGAAVADGGWPTLGQTRGRVVLMFDDEEAVRDAYSRGGTSLKGRLLFVDATPGDATAAVAILNNPVKDANAIQAALAANLLVRTMIDDPGDDDAAAAAGLEAGLAVGATWLSTNTPAPVPGRAYSATIPTGTPARCNPKTAPPSCTPQDIERLDP